MTLEQLYEEDILERASEMRHEIRHKYGRDIGLQKCLEFVREQVREEEIQFLLLAEIDTEMVADVYDTTIEKVEAVKAKMLKSGQLAN